MREIIFRAWDKSQKFMITYDEISHFDLNCNNGNLYWSALVQINEYECIQEQAITKLNDVVLMQFTGLKDKNGKMIFEGDILKTRIEEYYQDTPYIVEDLRELYFEINREDNYYRINEIIVIGNIFENKELLEVKNGDSRK